MADRLRGKVAFITGAGAGMGRESAVLFAEEGARVVVADIDGEAAAETVKTVEASGGQGLAVVGDVQRASIASCTRSPRSVPSCCARWECRT